MAYTLRETNHCRSIGIFVYGGKFTKVPFGNITQFFLHFRFTAGDLKCWPVRSLLKMTIPNQNA